MKPATFGSIAVLASLLALVILAATAQNRGGPDGAAAFSPPPDVLRQFDADGDGELNSDEREAMRETMRRRFGGGPGGPGGFGPQSVNLTAEFDADGDGTLDRNERARARAHLAETRSSGGGPGRFGGRGRGPGGPGGRGVQEPAEPGKPVAVGDVAAFPDAGLYDPTVLRTLFFEFESDDWLDELNDFYRTDVEIPARLTVDGKTLADPVGVRVRGNTSSMMVAADRKKSLNVSIDYGKSNQRLHGYRTLNLLNAHTDPTFMREMLFNQIAANYLPSAKTSLVRVVLNGEHWGVYVNSQQFNKDFLADWFGVKQGTRWRVSANPRGGNGLGYLGNELEPYRRAYELKSGGSPGEQEQAWRDLIELCRALRDTPADRLESDLDSSLNLDRALWFMAMDNVVIDNDGYWVRASDFALFRDPNGRFHTVPYDNNETFKLPGGPGMSSGGIEGVGLDPLYGEFDESKPLLYKLMESSPLRSRYLAHVRTIAEESLDWDRLEPVIDSYRRLIDADVESDTRRLYSYDAFVEGVAGVGLSLKRFIQERRDYLLAHPDIAKPTPRIADLTRSGGEKDAPSTTDTVPVSARIDSQSPAPGSVWLYYATRELAPFTAVPMERADAAVFHAQIPPQPAGTVVRYYAESRSPERYGPTSFYPSNTEMGALRYTVVAPRAQTSPVLINEIVAANQTTISDPQGEYDDWIELINVTDSRVDLSGMFLSDNPANPRKWRFPDGTVLEPRSYLLVWADENGKTNPGLHANFKLAKSGEQISLFDTDANHNRLLDRVEFGALDADTAYARDPSDQNAFKVLKPSPAAANRH